MISCANDGSIAYGHIRNLVNAAGVFALDAARAISDALAGQTATTAQAVIAVAEQSTVQLNNQHQRAGCALTWVHPQMVQQAAAWRA